MEHNSEGWIAVAILRLYFTPLKGELFMYYIIYTGLEKKNQILKLKYEIPMYSSQCETFSGG